ncbi:MAG: dTMP kinase [Actinomycetes bacterium]
MSSPADADDLSVTQEHDLRGVLQVRPFRRLWIALSLSSLGDWLGFLAITALAANLAKDSGYAAQSFAVGGVLVLRLLPAVIFGPVAGIVADRLDRRWTMVCADVARGLLIASIPLVHHLWWLLIVSFLVEVASMFWIPAKEATVPNLVPRERLESANQLSLITTYGSAPVAAGIFSGLALLTGLLGTGITFFADNRISLAVWFDALTFLVSAGTIFFLHEIPSRRPDEKGGPHEGQPTAWRTLVDGWRFVSETPLIRGVVVGMAGAFAAGGAVVGVARVYVNDLGAGEPGYGVLFGAVFLGLAAGMFLGPRLVPTLSRRRMFGACIAGAGLALAALALIPQLVIVVLCTLVLGAFAGVAWVTGYTLLGLEVADDLRGRTFAFVQTLARVVLVLVIAVAPLVSGLIGTNTIELTDNVTLRYNGAAITLLIAAVVAVVVGLVSYRQMDDHKGVPLWREVVAAARGEELVPVHPGGVFVAVEGGEGAGKSTQVRMLAAWLRDRGHEAVLTHEPGDTPAGARIRDVLLDVANTGLSPRAEALLYAADRAEHVSTVIRPALSRGAVVVTDRYVDSSLAYQGAGRTLPRADVGRLSRWATEGLKPNLTVVLDVPAVVGLARCGAEPDRLESEPLEFHARVRESFLRLARRDPQRYLVVDATAPPEEVAAAVRERLADLVPDLTAPPGQDEGGGPDPATRPVEVVEPEAPAVSER